MVDKAVPADVKEHARRELKAAMVARGCEDVEPLRVAIEAAVEARFDDKDINEAKNLLRQFEVEITPLAFTDVTRAEMEAMQASTSREEIVALLSKCMHLSKDCVLSEVLAEYHYHNFMFCKKHNFGPEQASAFLSVMRVLHTKAVTDGQLQEAQARKLLDKLLERHCRQLPPFSVGVFSKADVSAIWEYASRTFFRHYAMYAYMYTQRKDIYLRQRQISAVPQVPAAVPLHKDLEIDPAEAPELQDILQAEAVALDGNATLSPSPSAKAPVASAPKKTRVNPKEAEVLAAIDEAVKARLGDLDARLRLP